MFTVIATVAVVGIVYWTDRLWDKEVVQRPAVFDDDMVRQTEVVPFSGTEWRLG